MRRERTNDRISFCQRLAKSRSILGLWPKRGNVERPQWIEQRKKFFGRLKPFNGKNERAKHPSIVQANVLSLFS